jgi:hypothetical protein
MTRLFRTVALSVAALTALALTVLPGRAALTEDDKPCPIEGAWKLIELKNGDAQEYQKLSDGMQMFKLVTGGRIIWTRVKDGRIDTAAGGKYTVDKDKYTETIEYVHPEGQAALVGKTFDFTWKVDGDTWLHVGSLKIDNQEIKIDEKWQRCK